jgi:hypothetical protein
MSSLATHLSLLDFSGWIETQPDIKTAADDTIARAQSQNNLVFDVPYP